ncbi:MAG: hypothetical protein IZT59_13085 [Verrucomicrobia bacterium]|nr:hypothetical protein [Verrucomicrobiota bacterium]
MTKLQITTALGAALLVVSCEPILVHPSEQDAAARDGSGQDTAGPSKSPDIRDKSRRDKARRGPWIRGSGYPVESEGFQPEAQRQLEAESRPIRDEYPVAVRTGDTRPSD